MKLERRAALITGASAGIGVVYAKELALREKYDLILVARREERLKKLQAELLEGGFRGRVEVLTCDLRQESERTRLFQQVTGTAGFGLEVELLINNAGFGYVGSFLSDSAENQQDMLLTNCVAPLHLAKLFLPPMVSRRSGAVINLASVAAYPPIPYMATYGASKAFLLNWSVAVREELRATGVRMLAVCPGPTESDFHIVAGVQKKIAVTGAMTAEAVVRASLVALEQDDAVIVTGLQNALLTAATSLFSKRILAKISGKMISHGVPPDRL